MAILLFPPERTEGTKGFLWFRKREVGLSATILDSSQVVGVGLAMVTALKDEFLRKKRITSITINFIGDTGDVTQACDCFRQKIGEHQKLRKWLFEKVPLFTLNLATIEGELFTSYAYYTEKGKRKSEVSLQETNLVEEMNSSSVDEIVPRVKNIAFKNTLEQLGIEGAALPIVEPLVADLVVTYAFESGDVLQMVTDESLRKFGVSREEVRRTSVEHIRERTDRYRLKRDGDVIRILTSDFLEASLLLRDEVWPVLQKEVDGDLVVVVPARDKIAFTGANSKAGLKKLKKFAESSYANEMSHAVSKQLLVRRGQSWEVFGR